MVSSLLLPLALSAVGALASALPDRPTPVVAREPAVGKDGFLSFPISRREVPSSKSGKRLRRRADDTATLFNLTNTAYVIELDIGTPAQRVPVVIDTGSYELWVDPDCSGVTDTSSVEICNAASQYFPSQSTTAEDAEESSFLAYGSGEVEVEYVYDSVSIPGTSNLTMTDVQFGVALASEGISLGILGVGFGNGFGGVNYSSVLDEMVLQGVAPTRAFSLVLGTSNSTSKAASADITDGSFIFSGVDTKKFSGPLQQFDNLSPQAVDDNSIWRYWVELTNTTYTKKSKGTPLTLHGSTAVVLDSGSTIASLPSTLISALASALGKEVSTTDSATTINGTIPIACDAGSSGDTVDFSFGTSLTINVPLADLIWDMGTGCIVGIEPSDGSVAILGDTFLRSAYVLFDQDNKKVYMAEAANCGTNEQALANATSYSFTGECTKSNADLQTASSAAGTTFPVSLTAAFAAFVGVQALMAMM